MATRFVVRETVLQRGETDAGGRVVYYEAGTVEDVTVTVSKAGGAFGQSAGSRATQVAGTLYKLSIHAGDLDTVGEVAFALTGATDTTYLIGCRVVEHDPWDIPGAVLSAMIAGYKTVAGSLADVLNRVYRAVGYGLQKCDTADNSIRTYDGPTEQDGLLSIRTKETTGTVTTITPS
jgi:hypothetical protein